MVRDRHLPARTGILPCLKRNDGTANESALTRAPWGDIAPRLA
jgi:hypothetical protein